MMKIAIAAAAALFACAVQANDKPAAPVNQTGNKMMTEDECKTAMAQCGADEKCKEKLKTENGCK